MLARSRGSHATTKPWHRPPLAHLHLFAAQLRPTAPLPHSSSSHLPSRHLLSCTLEYPVHSALLPNLAHFFDEKAGAIDCSGLLALLLADLRTACWSAGNWAWDRYAYPQFGGESCGSWWFVRKAALCELGIHRAVWCDWVRTAGEESAARLTTTSGLNEVSAEEIEVLFLKSNGIF
jgi:hypothetical protein